MVSSDRKRVHHPPTDITPMLAPIAATREGGGGGWVIDDSAPSVHEINDTHTNYVEASSSVGRVFALLDTDFFRRNRQPHRDSRGHIQSSSHPSLLSLSHPNNPFGNEGGPAIGSDEYNRSLPSADLNEFPTHDVATSSTRSSSVPSLHQQSMPLSNNRRPLSKEAPSVVPKASTTTSNNNNDGHVPIQQPQFGHSAYGYGYGPRLKGSNDAGVTPGRALSSNRKQSIVVPNDKVSLVPSGAPTRETVNLTNKITDRALDHELPQSVRETRTSLVRRALRQHPKGNTSSVTNTKRTPTFIGGVTVGRSHNARAHTAQSERHIRQQHGVDVAALVRNLSDASHRRQSPPHAPHHPVLHARTTAPGNTRLHALSQRLQQRQAALVDKADTFMRTNPKDMSNSNNVGRRNRLSMSTSSSTSRMRTPERQTSRHGSGTGTPRLTHESEVNNSSPSPTSTHRRADAASRRSGKIDGKDDGSVSRNEDEEVDDSKILRSPKGATTESEGELPMSPGQLPAPTPSAASAAAAASNDRNTTAPATKGDEHKDDTKRQSTVRSADKGGIPLTFSTMDNDSLPIATSELVGSGSRAIVTGDLITMSQQHDPFSESKDGSLGRTGTRPTGSGAATADSVDVATSGRMLASREIVEATWRPISPSTHGILAPSGISNGSNGRNAAPLMASHLDGHADGYDMEAKLVTSAEFAMVHEETGGSQQDDQLHGQHIGGGRRSAAIASSSSSSEVPMVVHLEGHDLSPRNLLQSSPSRAMGAADGMKTPLQHHHHRHAVGGGGGATGGTNDGPIAPPWQGDPNTLHWSADTGPRASEASIMTPLLNASNGQTIPLAWRAPSRHSPALHQPSHTTEALLRLQQRRRQQQQQTGHNIGPTNTRGRSGSRGHGNKNGNRATPARGAIAQPTRPTPVPIGAPASTSDYSLTHELDRLNASDLFPSTSPIRDGSHTDRQRRSSHHRNGSALSLSLSLSRPSSAMDRRRSGSHDRKGGLVEEMNTVMEPLNNITRRGRTRSQDLSPTHVQSMLNQATSRRVSPSPHSSMVVVADDVTGESKIVIRSSLPGPSFGPPPRRRGRSTSRSMDRSSMDRAHTPPTHDNNGNDPISATVTTTRLVNGSRSPSPASGSEWEHRNALASERRHQISQTIAQNRVMRSRVLSYSSDNIQLLKHRHQQVCYLIKRKISRLNGELHREQARHVAIHLYVQFIIQHEVVYCLQLYQVVVMIICYDVILFVILFEN
jgi:hypothetical protein